MRLSQVRGGLGLAPEGGLRKCPKAAAGGKDLRSRNKRSRCKGPCKGVCSKDNEKRKVGT